MRHTRITETCENDYRLNQWMAKQAYEEKLWERFFDETEDLYEKLEKVIEAIESKAKDIGVHIDRKEILDYL